MEEQETLAEEFREGNVKLTLWEQHTHDGIHFFIMVERLYITDKGKWHSTPSLRQCDLANLASAAARTNAWLDAHAPLATITDDGDAYQN